MFSLFKTGSNFKKTFFLGRSPIIRKHAQFKFEKGATLVGQQKTVQFSTVLFGDEVRHIGVSFLIYLAISAFLQILEQNRLTIHIGCRIYS